MLDLVNYGPIPLKYKNQIEALDLALRFKELLLLCCFQIEKSRQPLRFCGAMERKETRNCTSAIDFISKILSMKTA